MSLKQSKNKCIAKFLIFLMIIQSLPIFELTHYYKWDPGIFQKRINQILHFIGPKLTNAKNISTQEIAAKGIEWLISNQNSDGSWGDKTSQLSNLYQCTSEALKALSEYKKEPFYINGVNWFNRQHPFATDHLSFKIETLAGCNKNVNLPMTMLSYSQNIDGGFGLKKGHQSDIYHTSLAIKALSAGQFKRTEVLINAINYLLKYQNIDGSFGLLPDLNGTPYYTSYALISLKVFQKKYDTLEKLDHAIENACNWLLKNKNNHGWWEFKGSRISETSLAIYALTLCDYQFNNKPAIEFLNNNYLNGNTYDTATTLKTFVQLVSKSCLSNDSDETLSINSDTYLHTNMYSDNKNSKFFDREVNKTNLTPKTVSMISSQGKQSEKRALSKNSTNLTPISDAGDNKKTFKNHPIGSTLQLDGSDSVDPDGDNLKYHWFGPSLNYSSKNPYVFIPEGKYTVSLVVDDGFSVSKIDTAEVQVDPHFNLVGNMDQNQSVYIQWNHKINSDEKFVIYRSDQHSPSNFQKIGTVNSLINEYIDIKVSENITYLYTVGAGKNNNYSFSNVIAVHTPEKSEVKNKKCRKDCDSGLACFIDTIVLNAAVGQIYTQPNFSPVIYSPPISHATTNIIYNYDVNAVDPENNELTYSLIHSPDHMIIDSDSGRIVWTPLEAGEYSVTVIANDDYQLLDSQTFTIKVNDFDIQPEINIDLEPLKIDVSGLTINSQTLLISGNIEIEIINNGVQNIVNQYDVVIFEDTNTNQTFDQAVDKILGTKKIPHGPVGKSTINVSVDIDGNLLFKDNIIYVFIDAKNEIDERDEGNNIIHSMTKCENKPPVGSFDPGLEWEWKGGKTLTHFNEVDSAPVVINLTDDNSDGKIDTNDVPDVVFISFNKANYEDKVFYGILRAVSGDSGEDIFTVEGQKVFYSSNIAAGDIDKDGLPEIIAIDVTQKKLIAFENDGSLKWKTKDVIPDIPEDYYYHAHSVTLGDIDNDGQTDIIVGKTVIDHKGNLKWIGKGNGTGINLSIVANVNLSGNNELIAGNTVYYSNGDVFWEHPSIPDGYNAIANLDDDVYPEIVLVASGHLYIFSYNGDIKLKPVKIPVSAGGEMEYNHGGPPTIADFDNDGNPEIGIAGGYYYVVFETDGTILWKSPTQDLSSNRTGSSVFDFDGDGKAEVVYSDELFLRIYNGMDGNILFKTRASSITALELPVVVDVDNDNNAEIVVVSNTIFDDGNSFGIQVYGDKNDTWVNTRKIWNQHAYCITNVNDDGTIPKNPPNNWDVFNNFRQNEILNPFACIDITASYIRMTQSNCPESIEFAVRIGNGSALHINPGVSVSFFNGKPENGGQFLGTSKLSKKLNPGQFEDIYFTFENVSSGLQTVYVRADDDGKGNGKIREIDEENNIAWAEFNFCNQSPTINSVPIKNATEGVLYQYDVNAIDPENDDIIYALKTYPSGMTINESSGLIKWTPDSSQSGIHSVGVIARDIFEGSDTQSFSITVKEALNSPPKILSSPVETAVINKPYTYQIKAEDPDLDTIVFELSESPNEMNIDSVSGILTWTPETEGQFKVTIKVLDDKGAFSLQNFQITVTEKINHPPEITSKPSTIAIINKKYSYRVIVLDSDNDIPFTYSLNSKPDGMTINETGLITWNPDTNGTYPVTVRVVDSRQASVVQSFSIQVLPEGSVIDCIRPDVDVKVVYPPDVNPEDNVGFILGTPVTIRLVTSDNVAVVSQALKVNQETITLNEKGEGKYTSNSPGIFKAVGVATDAAGNEGFDSEEFRFLNEPDDQFPIAKITSPAIGSSITLATNIIGTASDDNLMRYTLSYSPAGKNNFIRFAEGKSSVTNGVLGKLDPSMLKNGAYDVKLIVDDTGGQRFSYTVSYNIEGNLKVGNFSLSFKDLEIPVSGIPITISRNYDSRDKGKRAFGVGWTLGMNDIKISENVQPGKYWVQQPTGDGGFFPIYELVPAMQHKVTVSFPNNRSDEFEMLLKDNQGYNEIPIRPKAFFRSLSGTFSHLVSLDKTSIVSQLSEGGAYNLVGSDNKIYDPSRYQFTDVDGSVFVIHQETGIERIIDANGNTITFEKNGIIHSAGKSVLFTRDGQNRIIMITDPMGNEIHYQYDAYGDLISVTDQEGNVTRFTYNHNHGLVDIIDPRGVKVARTEYDDDGRVISHTDADGNTITYDRDIDGRQETIKNRRGYPTVYYYDENGNVLTKFDAKGNKTTYTYDENNRKTSETNPLGDTKKTKYDARGNVLQEIDEMGNIQQKEYNQRNQINIFTDQLNNDFFFKYDNRGRHVASILSSGAEFNYSYDDQGNLLSETGCCGSESKTYEYDDHGNRIKEIDAKNNMISYTYDDNGNERTKIRSRTTDTGIVTMTTEKMYNFRNQVIKETDADGFFIKTGYNRIGKKEYEIDKNTNRTEFEYDAVGNLVFTKYPDGTTKKEEYDEEGNRTFIKDRDGKITKFKYDRLNLLEKEIKPLRETITYEYDANGNRVLTKYESGKFTKREYNAAGKVIKITSPHDYTMFIDYDAKGNPKCVTDANDHVTCYEYNEFNRRTKTIYHDGSVSETSYIKGDLDNKKEWIRDQAGYLTNYKYDANGNLEKVIDELNQETIYTYDEVGNLITHTDPMKYTTRFAYDNQGRMTKHIFPSEDYEEFTYDPNGNLKTKTDCKGNTITYEYDSMNRLEKKKYPDHTKIEFELYYQPEGKKETITDSRGTTTLNYNIAGDLTKVIQPEPGLEGLEILYTYDLRGNMASITVPSGTTSYSYDQLNRLVEVKDINGGVTYYTYDKVGNRKSISYPNGTVTEYEYDELNRLKFLVNKKSEVGDIISSYKYDLGPAGNRTKVTEHNGRTLEYKYDNLYRLEKEIIKDPVLGDETITYSYDKNGNRKTKTDSKGTINYKYNENNQLTEEARPNLTIITYKYDKNGNLKSKTQGNIQTIYEYDYEDRLISATTDNVKMTYEYDSDGIRVSSSINGNKTYYIVDKNRDFAQVLEERRADGSLIVSYTYGDDLISQQRDGKISYYHYDGQMSTRQLTDKNKVVTDHYVFDAFGILLHKDGNTINNYLYTGEQYDPNIGFYYLRARYYDINVGRFISVDPYDGNIFEPRSLHKYLYCINDPVNNIDPSGNSLYHLGILLQLIPFIIYALEEYFMVKRFTWLSLLIGGILFDLIKRIVETVYEY